VHQLRYAFSPIPQAAFQLRHGYLSLVAVPVALTVLAAIIVFARQALSGGGADRALAAPLALRTRWLRNSGVLVFVFVVQETLEGLSQGGGVDLASTIFSRTGAIAVGLALVMGVLIAVLEREAEQAIRLRRAGLVPSLLYAPGRQEWHRVSACWALRTTFLADAGGRAPPSLPVTS
jgi:hypothetical protein